MSTKFGLVVTLFVVLGAAIAVAAFDTSSFSGLPGYNDPARLWQGSATEWCMGMYGMNETDCAAYMTGFENDDVTMNWNKKQENCNAHPDDAGYCTGAWISFHWNGEFSGASSGSSSHQTFVWRGPCVDGDWFEDGGYCYFGSYEVVQDMGTDPFGDHYWYAHATPMGRGS